MAQSAWVGMVRAVNVGGTGKLPSTELAAACRAVGMTEVKTYLASGNVVFLTSMSETGIASVMEMALSKILGKPTTVLLRTEAGLRDALARNPFADCEPSRTLIYFLPEAADTNTVPSATGRKNEEIAAGGREIFVHYPDGIGESRLRIPAAQRGTARNLNTVRKLADMACALDASRAR